MITPEELILMERAEHTPTRTPEPKRPRKFKQTFVTYFGSNQTLQHAPAGEQYILSYPRGTAINLWHELWRLDRRLKEDPDLLMTVYNRYAEYYTRKANTPNSDWFVQHKLLGVPIETVGKDTRSLSLQLREVIDLPWEKVISKVKDWKDDEDTIRPYPELVTLLYNLELSGMNRKTLLQFLMDELAELNNRDARQRETSE